MANAHSSCDLGKVLVNTVVGDVCDVSEVGEVGDVGDVVQASAERFVGRVDLKVPEPKGKVVVVIFGSTPSWALFANEIEPKGNVVVIIFGSSKESRFNKSVGSIPSDPTSSKAPPFIVTLTFSLGTTS